MKIKILFLIPTLQGGGSERVFSTLAQNIDPSVFEPVFGVLDGSNAFYSFEQSKVRLIDLKKSRVSKSFWAIRQLIKTEKPHIVISTLSQLNIVLATWRFWLAPRTTRFISRESTVMSLNSFYQKPRWLYNLLTHWFYPGLDAIICQSNDMYEDFTSNFNIIPEKLHIINNPINHLVIEQKIQDKSMAMDMETAVNIPRFVRVSRLEKDKGMDRLLTILSKFDFPFVFDIVGDGQEKEHLMALAEQLNLKDKVRFWGALKNPFPLVAAADIFLFTSFHEGFPNVLIEAGVCGTPIVAFECKGGINEIIQQGINGYIVADNDFEAFEKAVRDMLLTPLDRANIAHITKERFDLPMIIKKYEAVFKKVATA